MSQLSELGVQGTSYICIIIHITDPVAAPGYISIRSGYYRSDHGLMF